MSKVIFCKNKQVAVVDVLDVTLVAKVASVVKSDKRFFGVDVFHVAIFAVVVQIFNESHHQLVLDGDDAEGADNDDAIGSFNPVCVA